MNLRAFLNTLGVLVVAGVFAVGLNNMTDWLRGLISVVIVIVVGVSIYREFDKRQRR